tara:strand:- start:752 stop:1015 length:264 start_codon:yes stop_codon:yes gene_type:complete
MKNQTVEQSLLSYLQKNGMSEDQSKLVILDCKEEMKHTFNNWDSLMDVYSTQLQHLLICSIKPIALNWLNNNKPKAWFKPMFESKTY